MPIKALSTMSNKESFDEVRKRIRGAMRERGLRRESESADTATEASWDMASDRSDDEEPKKDQ
jgi:glycerol-3-phosphate O-acyltransferase/dihydroxyacetone phosphate acyltransferase